MKKNFIYLCLIVIIVLIACSGKEDDKKETIQIMQYCILCKFAYKKNIKGIEVNKRGYFNFQNTISKY